MIKIQQIIIVLFAILFTGCFSSYPMGLNDKEWNSLSITQQSKLKTQQYEIDVQRAIEREKQRTLKIKFLEKQRIAEENRISELYAKAQYEDIININFYKGFYQVSKRWYPIEPDTLTLVKGEIKKFKIKLLKNNRIYRIKTLWVKYDINGTKLTIYQNQPRYDSRGMVILNSGNWYKERRYSKNLNQRYSSIKNMVIGVRYQNTSNNGVRVNLYKYK